MRHTRDRVTCDAPAPTLQLLLASGEVCGLLRQTQELDPVLKLCRKEQYPKPLLEALGSLAPEMLGGRSEQRVSLGLLRLKQRCCSTTGGQAERAVQRLVVQCALAAMTCKGKSS